MVALIFGFIFHLLGKFTNWQTIFKSRKGRPVRIVVNGYEAKLDSKFFIESSGTVCFADKARSDRLTNNELGRMNLRVSQLDF